MNKDLGRRTALLTAFNRSYHSRYDTPLIFDNALAFAPFLQSKWGEEEHEHNINFTRSFLLNSLAL